MIFTAHLDVHMITYSTYALAVPPSIISMPHYITYVWYEDTLSVDGIVQARPEATAEWKCRDNSFCHIYISNHFDNGTSGDRQLLTNTKAQLIWDTPNPDERKKGTGKFFLSASNEAGEYNSKDVEVIVECKYYF